VCGTCGRRGRGEKNIQGFGTKAKMKDATWKTKALGDWLGECRLNPAGSG
jgi:hypothetical protein